jgi:outer membrane protein TolC
MAGLAAVRDALRQIETLQATQRTQVESMEAMLKAGGADQLDLASAQVELRLTDLAGLDAGLKAQQALGQLEDAMQVPFEALSGVEQGGRASSTKEKKS